MGDDNWTVRTPDVPDEPEDLFKRVVSIIEQARTSVVRTVNSSMVIAYWLIGREIVTEEQKGQARAEYGAHLIENLSERLTKRYGKGFSTSNLWYFRQFYFCFEARETAILHTVSGELPSGNKLHTVCGESDSQHRERISHFSPALSWSHYRLLMQVENPDARSFYEIEAERNRWSVSQLERQISTLLFERLLKSRDREGLLQLASEGQVVERPLDIIKDPYVLEFLDIPESHRLVESTLEAALITHLQEFLLELGTGFAFVGRQKRLTLDGDHFYPDLVFYHTRLKCYVIIDLKMGKLDHGDLGQMQMYVHYFDRDVRGDDDNPSIGIILCTDKNDAVVRYVLGEENERIFASRYRLMLPDEAELVAELKRELRLLQDAGLTGARRTGEGA